MQRKHSVAYTIGFAAAICLACAILVSSLAVALGPMQNENRKIDKQKNVLIAAGILSGDDDQTNAEIIDIYEKRVQVESSDGMPVYKIMNDGVLDMVVLPIEGKGLWSTLYGFLALDSDTTTIRGIAFYQHGETPGLGGEVDNPKWRELWKGRKAFDSDWVPVVEVIKGKAGSVKDAPHQVDGLSGATLTSNGVTNLVRHWLGNEGYGPYLSELRKKGGARK